jgi:predicted NBD/HSP70 family sugar kinase
VAGGLLLEERGAPDGAPGRPSPLVRPRPHAALVLALEIAVDSLAVAVVGVGGRVIESLRLPRPRGHFSIDEIVADLTAMTNELPGFATHREAIIGIGVAVAGVVRRSDGMVSSAPNLGWRDEPLGARVAAAIGLDVAVQVANEADLGAMAELRRGAARGADDLLFIFGEVGIGGGIIVDGKALTGVAGYAGEVGHVRVNPHGRTCRCGSVGCWETEIGEGALLRLAGRPEDGGSEAVEALLRDAEEGDPLTRRALNEVGHWLGVGLSTLINIFNPRVIVLGGLLARIHPFVDAALEQELERTTLPGPLRMVRVTPSELGLDAPLIGAAEVALEPFLSDPAAWLPERVQAAVAAGA